MSNGKLTEQQIIDQKLNGLLFIAKH